MTPEELTQERAALLAEIDSAFADVSRDGGVSWSEADVLDGPGATLAERARARALDTDKSWNDLVDDPTWEPDLGTGGFSFLDAIGMRYYLPAAMTRSVLLGYDVGIDFPLTIAAKKNAHRKWQLERFGLLDPRQQTCIARYLQFMTRLLESNSTGDAWAPRAALDSHWNAYL